MSFTLNAGVGGVDLASDAVALVEYQHVKLAIGAATSAAVLAVAGNGVAGTGVLRVTLASDSTGTLAGVTTVTTVTTVSTVTSLSQFATNAIDLNNGASGAGTLRVTIANNSTGVLATVSTVTTVGTVSAFGTGTTGPMKAEDVAHGDGDMGLAVWAVRDDTLNIRSGTENDYEPFHTDANGGLWVHDVDTLADDAAFTPGTTRVFPIGLQADEAATDSVDEGDVGTPRMTLDRKVIVTVEPHTAGGLSVFNATSGDGSTALTNAAQAIKASAGQLYGWYIYNPNAVAAYVPIYNTASASVTVGTTNPLFVITIPATSAANVIGANGIAFSNAGWSAAACTTAAGNTALSTALEANFFYA